MRRFLQLSLQGQLQPGLAAHRGLMLVVLLLGLVLMLGRQMPAPLVRSEGLVSH